MKIYALLAVMATLMAARAAAQDAPLRVDCTKMPEDAPVVDACKGANVATSFGAFPALEQWVAQQAALQATGVGGVVDGVSPTEVQLPPEGLGVTTASPVAPAVKEVAKPAAIPVGLPYMIPEEEPPADGVGGIQASGGAAGEIGNDLQMRRIGELDAMQGKALNMNYANDLGYLQGFTNGQAKRRGGGDDAVGR